MKSNILCSAGLLLLPLLAGPAAAQERVPLPDGNGKVLVEEACSQCHDLDATFLYNGDDRKWEALVHDMVAFGARLTPAERDTVLEYLRASFSTDRVQGDRTAAPLPTAKGRDVMQASCIGCHGPTLIARKRLDRAGWETVVRRHATDNRVKVSPEEVDALLTYLAANFRPTAATTKASAGGKSR